MTIETSLAIWGAGIIATTAASWASLLQRISDKESRDEARFKRVEAAIGISNGNGAAFMRKTECATTHGALMHELDRIEERVEHAIERGEVAIDEGHRDRAAIKERLVVIEAKVNHANAAGG